MRFHEQVGKRTAIKLMTDGILLAETQGDRELRQYDRLIIDEAHERSLNIDFLLGYLKQLVERRRDLKLVITSATIDAERFSKHFDDAPVIEVSGRLYPVEVRYRPVAGDAEDTTRDEEEQALADAVDELCRAGPGDILVFLPGEREIRDAAQVLKKTNFRGESSAAVFAALHRGAGPGLQAGQGAPRDPRHQRGRDLAHGAAHPLRGRHRRRARQALQLPQQGGDAARRADLAGRRAAARGALRASLPTASASGCTRRRISRSARRSPIPSCCALRSPR